MESLPSISIDLSHIESGLKLIIDARKEDTLFVSADAVENNEAYYQLTEGCFYDYEFNNEQYCFFEKNTILSHKRKKFIGTIAPNIYVGTLSLPIIRNEIEVGILELEVQSKKSSYRNDYRDMLELITEKCTDLLLQANSPVSHHFETDFTKDSNPDALYQKFTFIKSVIDTHEFAESIHRIVSHPVTQWKETNELKDIRNVRRLRNSNIKEFATSKNRTMLPEEHFLHSYGVTSVPEKIFSVRKTDTVDTPENRFIKHSLEVFLKFCSDIGKASEEGSKLNKEAALLVRTLESYLHHSLFKEILSPETLKINSPILQRKEGYREILRVWLMFDLAAKLIWKGGDDVYSSGKKDIAVLYEYWLFFKLLELFQSIFEIDPRYVSDLIQPTKNGLNLQIKQGNHTALKGIYNTGSRKLNIRFNYNRSFSGPKPYPASGSWTSTMRPDYTLSFWPHGIGDVEAEKQELIVHIHFDAKYKIANLDDILNRKEQDDGKSEMDTEKEENRNGIYKNADLLKMHAYKDAIRRTGGAYVLYPGDKSLKQKGFHEIIPGLGAFPVRPSKVDSGISDLKAFIYETIEHFINRASQREKLAYRIYDIHKNSNPNMLKEMIPEAYGNNRALIPDDTYVLVGYCKDEHRHKWYLKNGLYNFRMDDDKGSLILDIEVTNARYLLLRKSGEDTASELFKIISTGPKVYSKQKLDKMGYPFPQNDYYLVIEIEKLNNADFGDSHWDFKQLKKYIKLKETCKEVYKLPGIPFTVSMTELMATKIK
jgi:predicted component of viral defense system (DUF524 family)